MKSNGKTYNVLVAILLLIMGQIHFAVDFDIIKNPKPNIRENRYTPLVKAAEIGTEVGKDQYMFKPHSLTLDRAGNLYIYDNLQAKIIKLDQHLNFISSFGKAGPGIGEFSGTGKMYPVYIKIGADGNLYAKDLKKRRVFVFDLEGHYLREIMYIHEDYNAPLTDSKGVTYFFGLKDGSVKITGTDPQQNRSYKIDRADYHYLFTRPTPLKKMTIYSPRPLLSDLSGELLLVYFTPSSVMTIIQDNRVKGTIRIWPADALSAYKLQLDRLINRNREAFKDFFTQLFVDGDQADIFYLHLGRNDIKKINALYQFNLKGNLQKVLYLKTDEVSPYTKFQAKKSGNYYAIEGEKITIYKEDIQ